MALFSQDDLAVFTIPGFDERMQAIRERIHPKLAQLGDDIIEPLSQKAGEPLYPHVAKHARRSVNPPEDTWVAFGPEKRGYKKHPYIGVAVSQFGGHTQVVAKPETWATDRPAMADRLDAKRPPMRLANFQDWRFQSAPAEQQADDAFWDARLHKMRLKTGGLDLGRTLPASKSVPDSLLAELDDFVTLYRILRGME
ncbi:DUF1054 family protein [Thiohalorhabdus sp.]|uniref:DUF1054 family protein n=1 Tax=Thiohalorhabdus sp. TaxID=3094134 RepID=UPI002FC2BACE